MKPRGGDVGPRRIWLVLAWLCCTGCFSALRDEGDEGRAPTTWLQITTPHFTVLSNAGQGHGRRVGAEFERMQAALQAAFPTFRAASGTPTVVFVLADEASIRFLIPTYGDDANAARWSGFYVPGREKNHVVIRTDTRASGGRSSFPLVAHEFTHGFFRRNVLGLPLWMDEGLAEFYGNTRFTDAEVIFGRAAPGNVWLLKHRTLLPFSAMLTMDPGSPTYRDHDGTNMFHAESWAAVHYFLMAPEVRDQKRLDAYLDALQNAPSPSAAAQRTFGDLTVLENRLRSYAAQRDLAVKVMPLPQLPSASTFPARELSAAEALTARADFMLATGNVKHAMSLLAAAQRADPSMVAVHLTWARAHLAMRDVPAAEAALSVALRTAPEQASVQRVLALLLIQKGGFTTESTPRIRDALEQVVLLQPEDAEAHALLSRAYAQDRATVGLALREALRARELEPGTMAFVVDVGAALLAKGDTPAAWDVAQKAQRMAIRPDERAVAERLVSRVRALQPH
jgi:hypothetical protein